MLMFIFREPGIALDDTLKRVTKLVLRHLPGEPEGKITPDTDLQRAGLDSMRMVALLVEVERAFGIDFPADAISQATFSSIRELHRVIAGCRTEMRDPWLPGGKL